MRVKEELESGAVPLLKGIRWLVYRVENWTGQLYHRRSARRAGLDGREGEGGPLLVERRGHGMGLSPTQGLIQNPRTSGRRRKSALSSRGLDHWSLERRGEERAEQSQVGLGKARA